MPALGVSLLAAALLVNVASNRLIEAAAAVMAIIMIRGVAVLAVVGLALADLSNEAPHHHFGLPGSLRTHAMISSIAIATAPTVLFDLRRIVRWVWCSTL